LERITTMRFRVNITRKEGLSDPEGVETARALADLGYNEVGEVHFGRIITLEIDGDDAEVAVTRVTEMCERLLANPVIEDYAIEEVE
jgi:phosphoribosylformylglycinamidine synthase